MKNTDALFTANPLLPIDKVCTMSDFFFLNTAILG